MCHGRFTPFLHKDSQNAHTIEFRFPNSSSLSATKLMQNMDDCSFLDHSTSTIKSIKESRIYAVSPALDKPFNSYLKFALLCGFFILQGTGQAAAGSDFNSGIQSNSFFGDLSDISTCFTSVRISSLFYIVNILVQMMAVLALPPTLLREFSQFRDVYSVRIRSVPIVNVSAIHVNNFIFVLHD